MFHPPNSSRRRFLKTAAAFAGLQFLPGGIVGLRANEGAANKVNLGFVGIGGRGEAHWTSFAGQNFVAFCDIDRNAAARGLAANPGVPLVSRYQDLLAQFASSWKSDVFTSCLIRANYQCFLFYPKLFKN